MVGVVTSAVAGSWVPFVTHPPSAAAVSVTLVTRMNSLRVRKVFFGFILCSDILKMAMHGDIHALMLRISAL
jgi:hypothetical protein